MNSATAKAVRPIASSSASLRLNSLPAADEPTISTISAGTKPVYSISRPNITSDSGSTTSARSDQPPSIFSLLRSPEATR